MEVVGGVDDVAAEVRQLAVSVAPMRIARGLQNKVLEAMAAAKPVVLTAKAAEGIRARDGQHYLIADTAPDITQRVTRLLNDPEERARIGAAARRFVAANHRWEDELQMFELIVAGTSEPKTIPVDSIPGAVATQLKDELVPTTARLGR